MEEGDDHTGGSGFAEAIRAWRERRGWTQEELSHASGLSTRAIRSLERGRTLKPRRTTVQMLADALQVPRTRLMGTVRRAVAETDPDDLAGEAGDGTGFTAGGIARTGSLAADGGFSGLPGRAARPRGGVPRELPPDLGDPALDVREVVAELMAGPTRPYRAAVVQVATSDAAIRAAHHASAKFPDGQLYANLAATPATPPAAVLRRFLRSLQADRPAEATADELAAAFRSALAGRRMLVVLVGARSEAQIRPLIPAEAQCALLVAFGLGPHPETLMGPEPDLTGQYP
ncbi:transcriptional regulator with XRE-family HTH domain [Catenulispora sp. MAP12-49]|uniref:helix-turn-helix domain-containing protein n=1 Tax=Catenulispora sp. MAP12-49 TaxID=3156302 RepID=UPI0035148925